MLEGFTIVIAAFFVFCLYKQEMIRHRTYYYVTFVCLIGIILFETLFYFLNDTYGRGFCAIMLGLLHAGALILTMGYVGGISLRQIGSEIAQAAEDIRTGGDSGKPVIVPLTGAQPAPRKHVRQENETDDSDDAEEKPRIVIELPKKEDKGPIPTE